MLRILLIHAGFPRNIRHVPLAFDPQEAAHIPKGIGTLVMRLGAKTMLIHFQKIFQALRRVFDFFKRNAPTFTFCYGFGFYVIPLFMPHLRFFGEVT